MKLKPRFYIDPGPPVLVRKLKYRKLLQKGIHHPADIVAQANSLEELKATINRGIWDRIRT